MSEHILLSKDHKRRFDVRIDGR